MNRLHALPAALHYRSFWPPPVMPSGMNTCTKWTSLHPCPPTLLFYHLIFDTLTLLWGFLDHIFPGLNEVKLDYSPCTLLLINIGPAAPSGSAGICLCPRASLWRMVRGSCLAPPRPFPTTCRRRPLQCCMHQPRSNRIKSLFCKWLRFMWLGQRMNCTFLYTGKAGMAKC